MTAPHMQKTPAAVLADERGEGLNSPLTKKESITMVSTAASTRLDLDGLTVDVDVIDDHVEVTAGIPGRTTLGLALTRAEACRLASALIDALATRQHTQAESLTPAKYAARLRAEAK